MTAKADFSEADWKLVASGPPSAGMIVITASRGGTFRETFSMAKAYTEARQEHGQSELLDEIVSQKPVFDRERQHSAEELRAHSLQTLREAVGLVEQHATPEELDAYKRFILALSERVANAHKEGGEPVSDAERAAIGEIEAALG
ncbi:MAG: hypothetical protein QOJ01_537 [Solirubrobacterales bacterium]|jgi:hypothetical protein|nr:hypothetical protein [Solirubrobacterales bacterium]